MRHTCETGGRSGCEPCMLLEVELWDAINLYAIAVGGDPAKHVYGNVSRMQAVADVGKIVARVAAKQWVDKLIVGDLTRAENAAAERASKAVEMERDLVHLRRLYAESRDYVSTLERERHELVASGNKSVIEIDRLDAEVERMRLLYVEAKRLRENVPCATADEMRERGFHTTTCYLVEVIDLLLASEPTASPYRGSP